MPSHILALDQGTTSSRAIVYDCEGNAVASAQREFAQLFPQPGWVEHDPTEIWSSQIGVAVEALSHARLRARDLAAVGITNQRETTIVWDRKSGDPLCNAIVWQDRRTAGFMDELKRRGCERMIREKTGLVADAYFSGSKVRWVLDNVPGARAKAEAGELAFGTVDTWLVHKLSSHRLHVTDASNASRTLLFNLHTGDWDDELLALFGVPRSMLPEVRASSEILGEVSTSLGLEGVPIAGVAGDQQAALFGQLCHPRGAVKETYGTGCFLLMNTGSDVARSDHGLVSTVAWKRDGDTTYALEGSVFVGGAVVQWLRDGLGLIRHSADVESLARSVDDSGGVYLVPAFAGLGAPHWDQAARGSISGLTRGTTAGHIARAALEGIAHQVADLVESMTADARTAIPELRVDGGAARNDLLMQFQADILQAPVLRPCDIETTARGAAFLAGLAVGFWKGTDELAAAWKLDRSFEPKMGSDSATELRRQWRRAVDRARDWAE